MAAPGLVGTHLVPTRCVEAGQSHGTYDHWAATVFEAARELAAVPYRSALRQQIIQKLRYRCDTGYEEMIPRPGAGDIEQVALGVIDFLSFAFSSLCKLRPGPAASTYKSKAVVLTAFCSSPVRRARLSVKVSAMRKSIG